MSLIIGLILLAGVLACYLWGVVELLLNLWRNK